MVSGLITDQSARMVAVPRPDIGDVDVWKVTGGGGRGWLLGDDRTWFWLAVDRRGRNAVIAPPDRSELALLEKRVLAGLTSGEVRAEVLSEAAEWHHREAGRRGLRPSTTPCVEPDASRITWVGDAVPIWLSCDDGTLRR